MFESSFGRKVKQGLLNKLLNTAEASEDGASSKKKNNFLGQL
jgi:hypothetical protein